MDDLSDLGDNAACSISQLLRRIETRDYEIGIMGLGYVGLPLALTAVKAGFKVVGFDTDSRRAKQLNEGISAIKHIGCEAIGRAVETGKFQATSDLAKLNKPDAILITVPTPLNRHREPDLSFVENSTQSIAEALRSDQLVVLESTSWPGTTIEVVKSTLESTGLACGKDFFLAFSSEREDPGNLDYGTATIPKVVGADDPASRMVACALYDALVVQTVCVSSSATAEAVKLTENIFRSVNIALVNELKIIFAKMGIDVWEVIEAAKTKPFGYMPFYPGPGLGGHCIPVDPFYLTWKAREYGVATRFIELAAQINSGMPKYVVECLATALDERTGRGLNGARVLVIGAAYKKNIDDMRESPSLDLIELLERRGAAVDYHDPHIPEIPQTRAHARLSGRKSQELHPSNISSYDVVLIATDHDAVNWRQVAEHAKLLIDTKSICARRGINSSNIIKA